jgi:hypothetical protein
MPPEGFNYKAVTVSLARSLGVNGIDQGLGVSGSKVNPICVTRARQSQSPGSSKKSRNTKENK